MTALILQARASARPPAWQMARVWNSSQLARSILDFVAIPSLFSCFSVCRDWHLIVKYLVGIPLLSLRALAVAGELLYWLPGENQFPKTVSLKLVFNNSELNSLQIVAGSADPRERHRYKISIVDVLFVIEGHWTPIFESLTNYADFENEEQQMFDRSKCFSIVTNTYMTYDFLSFTASANRQIVQTLRRITRQTSSVAKKMAIHTKANNLYVNQKKPLIFENHLAMLTFEMFVLQLQQHLHFHAQTMVDIPMQAEPEMSASALYPLLLDENVPYSQWKQWIAHRISRILNDYQQSDTETEESDANETQSNTADVDDDDDDGDEELPRSPSKHNRRQSSLFGQRLFPTDENIDLFEG